MKLVIQTQHRENYGAHDWDGKGECPQYWKFKGGETYVFPNLIPNDVTRIKESGIPTLTNLIETKDEGWEEYVIDWSFEDDDAVVCEKWESPWVLEYSEGKWVANRLSERDEFWKIDVMAKHESYTLAPNGERSNYSQKFEMSDGELLSYKEYNVRQKPIIETEYDGMAVIA